MKNKIWSLAVAVALAFATAPVRAEHEDDGAGYERPAFNASCAVLPSGAQNFQTTYGHGAVSADGKKAIFSNDHGGTLVGEIGSSGSNVKEEGRIEQVEFAPNGRQFLTVVAEKGVKIRE